jgi:hypothetical protein
MALPIQRLNNPTIRTMNYETRVVQLCAYVLLNIQNRIPLRW